MSGVFVEAVFCVTWPTTVKVGTDPRRFGPAAPASGSRDPSAEDPRAGPHDVLAARTGVLPSAADRAGRRGGALPLAGEGLLALRDPVGRRVRPPRPPA